MICSLYQKFEFHQQQEALTAPFDLTSFSLAFLSFWPLLFYTQGVFGWDFTSFLEIY